MVLWTGYSQGIRESQSSSPHPRDREISFTFVEGCSTKESKGLRFYWAYMLLFTPQTLLGGYTQPRRVKFYGKKRLCISFFFYTLYKR